MEQGYITTEELAEQYGYGHPPRAARDVREQGIPLVTFYVPGADGRRIAAYRFGNPSETDRSRLGGRRAWPTNLKQTLLDGSGSRCAVCGGRWEPRDLQIDHRVPYEIAGDPSTSNIDEADVMLLCASCNRTKSWTCEHCPNLAEARSSELCRSCYWATPDAYTHVALKAIRRADVVWSAEEVPEYDSVACLASRGNLNVPDFIKRLLREAIGRSQSS
ncbi:HNH endonuclease [Candidatus Palauibacter sp.]|uniref:HNH endonuclease n=1 Tax=Candidatus Palauibacter sp. TaxID=3101350 RepID=UPI003B528244